MLFENQKHIKPLFKIISMPSIVYHTNAHKNICKYYIIALSPLEILKQISLCTFENINKYVRNNKISQWNKKKLLASAKTDWKPWADSQKFIKYKINQT